MTTLVSLAPLNPKTHKKANIIGLESKRNQLESSHKQNATKFILKNNEPTHVKIT